MKRWCWVAVLWLVATAQAETLRVERMSVTPDPRWKRGDAVLEREDGVYLLEHAEGRIQAALPRRPTPMPHGEAAFQEQLRRKWQALHGDAARIEWRDGLNARWQVCEHPSRDRTTRIQQWVTGREGLAYAWFFFLPAEMKEAPAAIPQLLEQVRWGDAAAPGWRRVESFQVQPADLDAVLRAENRALGELGMVTGLGSQVRGNALEWFLEGFLWRAPPQRQPFRHQGRLEGEAGMTVPHAEHSVQRDWDICAPRPALERALQALRRGDAQGLEALTGVRPELCPPPGSAAARERSAALEQGGLVWRRIVGQQPHLPEAPAGRTFFPLLGVYSVYAPD